MTTERPGGMGWSRSSFWEVPGFPKSSSAPDGCMVDHCGRDGDRGHLVSEHWDPGSFPPQAAV